MDGFTQIARRIRDLVEHAAIRIDHIGSIAVPGIGSGGILGGLNVEETQEWHVGIAQAVGDETYFIAQPFHCTVETKPETRR